MQRPCRPPWSWTRCGPALALLEGRALRRHQPPSQVESKALKLALVEAKLGPIAAGIVHEALKVRRAPSRLGALDDAAAEAVRDLCLGLFDTRAVLLEVLRRLVQLRSSAALVPAYRLQQWALESLQVYCPLAHALGLGPLALELEDRCLQAAFPNAFEEASTWLRQQLFANGDALARFQLRLEQELASDPRFLQLASGAHIKTRSKSLISVLKKRLALGQQDKGGRGLEEVFDLLGMRLVVLPRQDLPPEEAEAAATEACYVVRGLVQSLWPPVEGRDKDYIARPKANGYQSLHTTVQAAAGAEGSVTVDIQLGEGGGGKAAWVPPLEVQIRTAAMDAAAQSGSAAHHAYKGRLDARQTRLLSERLALPGGDSTEEILDAMVAQNRATAAGAEEGEGPVLELFRHLDLNGDGVLSRAEVRTFLLGLLHPSSSSSTGGGGGGAPGPQALSLASVGEDLATEGPGLARSSLDEDVDDLMGLIDADGDGSITLQEFAALQQQASAAGAPSLFLSASHAAMTRNS